MPEVTGSRRGGPSLPSILMRRILDLKAGGNFCPTLDEVFYPVRYLTKSFDRRRVRDLLCYVRAQIFRKYGITLCSLSADYYAEHRDEYGNLIRASYRNDPPKTLVEGRSCLPRGAGDPIAGIYWPPGGERHDYILAASIADLAGQGILMQGTGLQRAQAGIDDKVLLQAKTVKMIRERTDQAVSERMTPLVVMLAESHRIMAENQRRVDENQRNVEGLLRLVLEQQEEMRREKARVISEHRKKMFERSN